MILQQKIFELKGASELFNLKSEEGDLILVVNGYTTSIKFEDLFISNIKYLKNGVKGHSILQNHKLEEGFLVDGDNNKYSLWFNKKNIIFKSIITPVIQSYDIELNEDEENKYLDVLIKGIQECKQQEKDEKIESIKENLSNIPVPKIEAKEVELEDIIEELEDQGYDHFGKDQYNLFLQYNKKPVLYIGKETADYVKTDYNEELKDNSGEANLTFIFNKEEIVIGIIEDGIIFPTQKVTKEEELSEEKLEEESDDKITIVTENEELNKTEK